MSTVHVPVPSTAGKRYDSVTVVDAADTKIGSEDKRASQKRFNLWFYEKIDHAKLEQQKQKRPYIKDILTQIMKNVKKKVKRVYTQYKERIQAKSDEFQNRKTKVYEKFARGKQKVVQKYTKKAEDFMEKTKHTMGTAREDNVRLVKDKMELKRENKQLSKQNAELTKKKELLKNQCIELQRQKDTLKEERDCFQDRSHYADARLRDYQFHIDDTRHTQEKYKEEQAKLRAQNELLRGKLLETKRLIQYSKIPEGLKSLNELNTQLIEMNELQKGMLQDLKKEIEIFTRGKRRELQIVSARAVAKNIELMDIINDLKTEIVKVKYQHKKKSDASKEPRRRTKKKSPQHDIVKQPKKQRKQTQPARKTISYSQLKRKAPGPKRSVGAKKKRRRQKANGDSKGREVKPKNKDTTNACRDSNQHSGDLALPEAPSAFPSQFPKAKHASSQGTKKGAGSETRRRLVEQTPNTLHFVIPMMLLLLLLVIGYLVRRFTSKSRAHDSNRCRSDVGTHRVSKALTLL